nr:hypothetical protein [Tanacetum cinerariifolium]
MIYNRGVTGRKTDGVTALPVVENSLVSVCTHHSPIPPIQYLEISLFLSAVLILLCGDFGGGGSVVVTFGGRGVRCWRCFFGDGSCGGRDGCAMVSKQ